VVTSTAKSPRRSGRLQYHAAILRLAAMLIVSLVSLIPSAIVVGETAFADVRRAPASGKDRNCEGVWPNPCGAACLGFALKHFGFDASSVQNVGNVARGVIDIEHIQSACQKASLHAERVQLGVPGLERLLSSQPSIRVIVAFKNDHFGYVEAVRNGQFCFITLSGKHNWWPGDKLATSWLGEAVVISKQPLPGDLVGIAAARAQVATKAVAGPAGNSPLRLVCFHSPSCHECQRVKGFLPQMTSRWGDRVALELHSVDDIDVFNELLKYEEHYGVTVAAPPAIFVGDKALVGDDVIMQQLGTAIEDALARQTATFKPDADFSEEAAAAQAVPSEVLSRFESFAPGAVAIAGLLDGVNPCAFTTIVFFLSMLAYLRKTRREMLFVGAGFTAGMFAAYFLLGLGLLGAVKTFSVSHGLSSGLACGVAILAFALAGWSLVDAVRYVRTGDTRQVTLGLPKTVKNRIHKVIRTGLTTRGLVIGSLSVGFLVSGLESLCTGQVYLPTIVFITRVPGMQAAAVGYLLLYNIMFIVPLVAILAMTYFGVRSERLGNMLRKRLALAKFGMAGLFAGLGVIVILTTWGKNG